jgi:hypothetical protein
MKCPENGDVLVSYFSSGQVWIFFHLAVSHVDPNVEEDIPRKFQHLKYHDDRNASEQSK